MGALQPVLTFLLATSTRLMPWSALDLAALVLAVCVGWAGRMAPRRARALLVSGLLVAGLGPLLAFVATLVPAATGLASEMASKAATGAPGACAVIGLLLLAAGCARLELTAGATRRRARLLEAFCLVVTAAGIVVAQLAAGAPSGAILLGEATVPLTSIGTAGWAAALAGSVGVVAADTSGRASGPVPYKRRVLLVPSATVYAAVVVTITALGVWKADAPFTIVFLAHLAQDAGLLLLAWSALRVLNRPAAADYWRGHRGTPARTGRRTRRHLSATAGSPRIVPTPPAIASPPARHVPGGIAWHAALVGASVPFTPPALRRSLLLQSADVPSSSGAAGASPRTPTPEPVAAPALAALSASTLAEEDTNRLAPDALDTNLAPRPALSSQFVAALLHLQAEMLRVGRTYSFEELVALFEDVHPRSSIASSHVQLLRAAQPAPELGRAFAPEDDTPIAPASLPGHHDSPPAGPRFRLNIVP